MSSASSSPRRPWAETLALATLCVSGGLLVALGVIALVYDSKLALAQAADSLSDVVMGTALWLSMRIARQPPDAGHPFGHQRAESIAALIAAVFAGVLAVEVTRAAVSGILLGASPRLEWPLAAAFAVKAGAKAGIAWLARRERGRRRSPALGALEIDARNDALVCALSLVGFLAARYGWAGLDGWLAIPVALWIAASGIALARENTGLLMGEAPSPRRQAELLELARQVPGVLAAHSLRARTQGAEIEIWVQVAVDEALTVRQAHDIGEDVQRRLEAEPDVCHAVAHVDVA